MPRGRISIKEAGDGMELCRKGFANLPPPCANGAPNPTPLAPTAPIPPIPPSHPFCPPTLPFAPTRHRHARMVTLWGGGGGGGGSVGLAPALVWPGALAQGHQPHNRPPALWRGLELGIHHFPPAEAGPEMAPSDRGLRARFSSFSAQAPEVLTPSDERSNGVHNESSD